MKTDETGGRAAVGRSSLQIISNAERREKTRSTCMDTGETGGRAAVGRASGWAIRSAERREEARIRLHGRRRKAQPGRKPV